MKFLGVLIIAFIGCSDLACAKQTGSALEPVKPIEVRIISRDDKGVTRREYVQCTPQTCCFSETFYCFMDKGHCVCDLYVCGDKKAPNKTYWMKIVGADAERVCGRPRMLHELTDLCLCNPDKVIPCGECNPPASCKAHPQLKHSIPADCNPD